jgi:hypothetical protein
VCKIQEKILKWAKEYSNISKENLDWFIKTTLAQIDSISKEDFVFYLFKLGPSEKNMKRHPNYSLYEFFLSFIGYQPNMNSGRIIYGELSYS